MAYQSHKKAEGAQIVRTPAPDAIDMIRNPKGQGYGSAGPQPSSVAPGHAVESSLAANLRESQDDGEGTLSKIIQGGLRGTRPDGIPDIADEERTVSATPYPPAFGAEGQQDAKAALTARLPDKLGAGPDDSAARRAAGLKQAGDHD